MLQLHLILLLATHISFAQELRVTFARDAYYSSGKKIRANAELSSEQEVFVKKDGQLNIRFDDKWTMIVKAGKHLVDSVRKAGLDNRDFRISDSIYNVLKSKGLINCQFLYQTEQAGVHAHRILDDIKVKLPRNLLTDRDTLTIRWENPIPYTGKYHVIVKNLFDEHVGLETTEAQEITLDLKRYKDTVLSYKITTEDCRESEAQIIRIE